MLKFEEDIDCKRSFTQSGERSKPQRIHTEEEPLK